MSFRGALVYKNDSDQNVLMEVNTQLIHSDTVYDTDSFFDTTTKRFVIPVGVSKVRLIAQAVWANNSTGFRQLVIKKNFVTGDFSTGWYPGVPATTVPANAITTTDLNISTPILDVVEGDNFLVEVYHSVSPSLNVLKSVGTWFAIEVIE